MGSPVSPLWAPPPAASVVTWQAVTARQLLGAANALNHLTGIQARGFAPASVYQSASYASGANRDVGWRSQEPSFFGSIVVPYFCPPGVELLHLVGVALSSPTPSTSHPEMTISIEQQSGASIDIGATWTLDAGTLPGRQVGTEHYDVLRPYVIESGARFSTLDPVAATPSGPRRMYVGGNEDSIVLIRVSLLRATLVSLCVIPLPPEAI